MVFYTAERKAALIAHLTATCDVVVDRVAPGVLDQPTQEGYTALLRELAAAGVLVLPAAGKPLLVAANAVDGDFVDFSGKVRGRDFLDVTHLRLEVTGVPRPGRGQERAREAHICFHCESERLTRVGVRCAADAGAYRGQKRSQLHPRCPRRAKVSAHEPSLESNREENTPHRGDRIHSGVRNEWINEW